MERYYKTRPRAKPVDPPSPSSRSTTPAKSIYSEYDRYRQNLVEVDDDEGWAAELRRYLKERPANVTNDMDIVQWWQVCSFLKLQLSILLTYSQDHAQLYPTLARIALDVLPCQASSVPCERLFSASKQAADDRRASLGAKRFEELQVMKFAWRRNITDVTAWNSSQVEEVDLDEYCEMLEADEAATEFETPEDEIVFEDWD